MEGTWTHRETVYDLEEGGRRPDLASVPCFRDSKGDPEEECWHHQYYQWVALVILVQAAGFYLPRQGKDTF